MKPRIHSRAIGYLRVSTGQQVESGLGLEAQEHAIRDAARRLGLELAAVYRDAGASGSWELKDRPALADALNTMRRGDVLLVAKRDRLARDTFVTAILERELQRKGARLVSAAGEGTDSDDPTAVFTRRILDAVAELERGLTVARTRAALRAKRARGERAGTEPYGWRINGDGRTLHPHNDEQCTLRLIQECRDAGFPLRAIADELNRVGIRTRTGSEWRHQYVASVIATTERHGKPF
jgi:DNA invertase Pin-like site-specific DNA recombinase